MKASAIQIALNALGNPELMGELTKALRESRVDAAKLGRLLVASMGSAGPADALSSEAEAAGTGVLSIVAGGGDPMALQPYTRLTPGCADPVSAWLPSVIAVLSAGFNLTVELAPDRPVEEVCALVSEARRELPDLKVTVCAPAPGHPWICAMLKCA
jgi:hypothetical protein